MNHLRPFSLFLLLLTSNLTRIEAQKADSATLRVLRIEAYLKDVASHPSKRLVNVNAIIPRLSADLKYATRNNFTGKRMYPASLTTCYLREEAAMALKAVSDSLSKIGFQLKIFDAYRPYAVTVRFWNLIKDERYVANPSKGSGHNRGIAVDLTLVEKNTGKEIDMGTEFDNFSIAAHHSYQDLKPVVLENRKILQRVMEHFGFRSLETEWWHYSLPNPQAYDVLNISFKELAAIIAIN